VPELLIKKPLHYRVRKFSLKMHGRGYFEFSEHVTGNSLFYSRQKPKNSMWKNLSSAYRIAKKNAAYRIKFAKNFVQPTIPAADTSMLERASAIIIAQRIPRKNNAHFLSVADSMDKLGFFDY
jgi:hypothetical protein